MEKETKWKQQNQETPKWKHEKTKINTENNDNFPILVFITQLQKKKVISRAYSVFLLTEYSDMI